jgi:hypothetical protein
LSTLEENSEMGPISPYPTHRMIDLEGINLDDGFGYSVTITSPPSTRNGNGERGKSRKLRKASNSTQMDIEMVEDEGHNQKMHIATTRTYSVDESVRDANWYSRNQFPTFQTSPEVMTLEMEDVSRNLSAWGFLDNSTADVQQHYQLEPGGIPPDSQLNSV